MSPRRLRPLFWLVAPIAFALLLGGCSAESKKAKRLAKAEEYFRAGDYVRAEIEYKNVLQTGGLDPIILGRLGLIYLEQVRLGRAGSHLIKAGELQPANLEIKLALAQWNLAAGKPAEARELALAILDRDPKNLFAPTVLADSTVQPRDVAAARIRLQSLPSNATVLSALGQLDLRESKVKEAEAHFEQALKEDPKLPQAHASLGLVYFSRKEADRAEKELAAASGFAPARHPIRLLNIQFNIQAGKVDVAKRLLDEMIKATPDYLPGYLYRASLAMTEKNFDEALSNWEKVLELEPIHPEALMGTAQARIAKGESDKALTVLERAATVYAQAPTVHLQIGKIHLANGDLAKASASLNEAVRLDATIPEAVIALAQVNIRLRNLGPAVTSLKGFLQKNPANSEAHMLLAEAYRAQGNWDDAIAIYQAFIASNPKSPELPFFMATAYLQQNKLAEARKALALSLEISPDFAPANEAIIELDLAEKKFAAAETRASATVAKNPKSASAHLLLGRVYLAQSNAAKAEPAFLKALELQPALSGARELLTKLYLGNQQVEKAVSSLKAAIEREPNDLGAQMQLGQLQERTKDFTGARVTYEKILAINPKFAGALNNLAYLYALQLGDLEKAQEMAQRAREILPTSGETGDTLGWVLLQRRQFSRALGLLEDSAEKLPKNAEVQYHLGMGFYLTGQEDRARTQLELALKLDKDFPGNDEARSALSVLAIDPATAGASAKAALEAAIAKKSDDPGATVRLAAILEREGNADKALALVEAALKSNPSNSSAALLAIRIYRAKKDTTKALELAKATRQLAPSDGRISHVLGRLTFENGDRASAVGILQDANRRLSGDPEVLFDLGEAAYSIGQLSVTESSYREALQVSPNFPRAKQARATLDLMALAQDPAKAAAAASAIDAALKSDPNDVPALMARAAIDESKGDGKAARLLYEKALSRYSDFTPAKRGLSIQLAATKEDDKRALELGNKARETFSTDADLARALGVLNYRAGNFGRAASLLQESARTRTTDAELQFYLGMAQRQMKDTSAGNRSLQRALDQGLSGELAAEARKAMTPAAK